MKKVITSIISLVTMASLLVGTPKKDIVDTAVGAGSFKTLVTAVKAAGLVDTLKSEGPFTVFAPTDEAFAKLSKCTHQKHCVGKCCFAAFSCKQNFHIRRVLRTALSGNSWPV